MVKILAIDDNGENLVFIKTLLSVLFPDAKIYTASSGNEGVALAKAENPDVILLDLILPEMDGFQTCKIIKDDQALMRIPVIVLTALKTDSVSRIKALNSGAETFLTKPIDESELKAQITSMLRIKKSEDKIRHEKDELEEVVQKRTSDLINQLEEKVKAEIKLKESYKELEKNKLVMLNLMEDLKSEIEQRKHIEEKLVQSKIKAEASDKLKTAFLNNISHEIRTPLNGILGFGQLMAEPDLSNGEKEKYLEVVNKSSYRLINTITDIMDISLIVSGSIEVHKKTFKVKNFLDEITLNLGKECSEKDLTLSSNTPEENSDIYTDAGLLQKILFHLLDNAVKFTASGSVTFGYTLDSNSFRFFVTDTGSGINPTARNRIFGNFMQEDISNTRGHEGSGLGLSIAKGLVELLGGEIDFESVKGQGSTFFFTIPSGVTEIPSCVTEIPSCVTEIPSGVTEIPSGVTEIQPRVTAILPVILVAEDDKTCYDYINAVLKNSPVILLSAVTGKEAVTLCRERSDISLILMDLKMPVMNGLEAVKLIKSFRKNLPVIAVTAHAVRGDEQRAISAGCDDYISKPFQKDLLLKKLEKYGVVIK
jgi:signal transduction histidine kinase